MGVQRAQERFWGRELFPRTRGSSGRSDPGTPQGFDFISPPGHAAHGNKLLPAVSVSKSSPIFVFPQLPAKRVTVGNGRNSLCTNPPLQSRTLAGAANGFREGPVGCMEVSPCTPRGDSPRRGTPQGEQCGETWLAAHGAPPGTAKGPLLCPTSHGPGQTRLCLGVRRARGAHVAWPANVS